QGLLNADLVFWGGPELEVFLNKPLQNIAQNKVIQFNKLKTLAILPFRQQDLMHHHDEHAHTHHHHTHLFDPHFWLDPNNALQLADHIRAVLCERDPDHCRHYQDNYAIFKTKLEKLTQALAKELKPYQNTKFLVLHDAYQYFE